MQCEICSANSTRSARCIAVNYLTSDRAFGLLYYFYFFYMCVPIGRSIFIFPFCRPRPHIAALPRPKRPVLCWLWCSLRPPLGILFCQSPSMIGDTVACSSAILLIRLGIWHWHPCRRCGRWWRAVILDVFFLNGQWAETTRDRSATHKERLLASQANNANASASRSTRGRTASKFSSFEGRQYATPQRLEGPSRRACFFFNSIP